MCVPLELAIAGLTVVDYGPLHWRVTWPNQSETVLIFLRSLSLGFACAHTVSATVDVVAKAPC